MKFDVVLSVVLLWVGIICFMVDETFVAVLCWFASLCWALAFWSARQDVSDHEQKEPR